MGLYERLTATDSTKIPVHDFGAAVHLWLLGNVNDARMVSEFSLGGPAETSGTDQFEMLAIKSMYNGLTTANKPGFLEKTHAVFLLAESGRLSKAEAQAVLGF